MVVAGDEARSGRCSLLEKRCVGVYARDCSHTLVHYSEPDRCTDVGSLHYVFEDLIHLLTALLVCLSEYRKQLQQPDLHPRRRRAVVVKLTRQPVLNNLLDDADEGGDHIVVRGGVLAGDVVQDAYRTRHYGGVPVAKRPPEVLHVVRDCFWRLLKKPVQRHYGLLPHMLAAVPAALPHLPHHRGDGLGAYQARHGAQGGANLPGVGALQVPLKRVDQQDEQLRPLLEEEARGEVPHLLLDQRRVLGHVDGVDVPEVHGVSEHFAVHHSNTQFLHP
mmetsp:Transcript_17444/g.42064  ORF Transcript_17444/g.42064 Transcript_17444/m.42064 type:complete len:276 (+) Transcript_17444:970-1797(+)